MNDIGWHQAKNRANNKFLNTNFHDWGCYINKKIGKKWCQPKIEINLP